MSYKQAFLFFRFRENDPLVRLLFQPMLESGVGWLTYHSSSALFSVSAKGYSLADHQFVRVKPKLESKSGDLPKDDTFELLLPRHYVVAIIEGEFKNEGFGFISGKGTRIRKKGKSPDDS